MIHTERHRCTVLARAAFSLCLLLPAAACVSESNAGAAGNAGHSVTPGAATSQALGETRASQPAHAVYNCGRRGQLTVDNFRTSVRLVDPEGDSVELPAAPATQQSRYGQTPYALVLDGNDALYMKSGKEPVDCRR